MRKARLLFTNECNRNCKGCCNKNWNGEPAKEISFYELIQYDEIFITGGEPMLFYDMLVELIDSIKPYGNKIFLYTALPWPYSDFIEILGMIDGCTLTLHSIADYKLFKAFNLDKLKGFENKSLRLNVFPKLKIQSDIWDIRPKVWIKDAPLPEGEEFVKLV